MKESRVSEYWLVESSHLVDLYDQMLVGLWYENDGICVAPNLGRRQGDEGRKIKRRMASDE